MNQEIELMEVLVFADYASGSLDEAGFVKTLEQVIQGAYAN